MSAREVIIKRLYSLEPRGITLGLERMHAGLGLLGHPEKNQNWIHVTGTNGKGSVCAMLASIAEKQGHKTGLFTSPHLHRINERIQIQGTPIPDAMFIPLADEVLETLSAHNVPISFFEAMTLIGLLAFKRAACDIGIIEVGLGGRLDATNVITPKLSIITSIGLDHTDRLGTTHKAIAAEKAGIIKEGVPVVIGPLSDSARQSVDARAGALNAPVISSEPYTLPPSFERQAWMTPVQMSNIATVVTAAKVMGWRSEAIQEGIAATRWPGRFEVIAASGDAPTFILDGAHNQEGCDALVQSLIAYPYTSPHILLFAAMRDKPIETMLRRLETITEGTMLVPLPFSRAFDPYAWVTPSRIVASSVQDAIAMSRMRAIPKGTITVAGSLYFIAEVRACLLGIPSDPPIQL